MGFLRGQLQQGGGAGGLGGMVYVFAGNFFEAHLLGSSSSVALVIMKTTVV